MEEYSEHPIVGRLTPRANVRDNSTAFRYTDLSIADVDYILRDGEEGRTQPMADLWHRMLKSDAHLLSVWETRIAGAVSADWLLETPEGGDDRLTLLCQRSLEQIPLLERVFSHLAGGAGVGYAVCEILWEYRGGFWIPVDILPINPRRFQFSDDYEIGLYDEGRAVYHLRNLGWEVDTVKGRGGLLVKLPAGKYMVHQPYSAVSDFPTATGLVHTISRWWWAKQQVIRYWLSGAQIAGQPRIIGKMTDSAVGSVAQDFLDEIADFVEQGVLLLRDGTELDMVQFQGGGGTAEVWEQLRLQLDSAMSKAVLGSTLNVEIGESGGNRAAAESQASTTIYPRVEKDRKQIWSTFATDLFRYIRDFNRHAFDPDVALPKGSFGVSEESETSSAFSSMAFGALLNNGKITENEARLSAGLDPVEGGTNYLPPPRSEPSLGAGGFSLSKGSSAMSGAFGDLWALDRRDRERALRVIGKPEELVAQLEIPMLEHAMRVAENLDDPPSMSDLIYRARLQSEMAGQLFVRQIEVPESMPKALSIPDARESFLRLPFDEAVDAFQSRGVVTPEVYRSMEARARRDSFSASLASDVDLVRRIRELLDDFLAEGGTMRQFQAFLAEQGLTRQYISNVLRTNVQSGYGTGRLQQLEHPAVVAARPFMEYRTARDQRVRRDHAALDGVVFDRREGDGWRRFAPPLGYQCRCALRTVRDPNPSTVVDPDSVSEFLPDNFAGPGM